MRDYKEILWNENTGEITCPDCKTNEWKITHGQSILKKWREGEKYHTSLEKRYYYKHSCGEVFIRKEPFTYYKILKYGL